MSKYKYYFRKPKSEIAKDILTVLMLTGAICIAATSPYFGVNLMRAFKYRKKYGKKRKKTIYNTFYRLKREGYIDFNIDNHQLYINLTDEGRKKAGRFQIDALEIKKPAKWDKKWRVVIFDIPDLDRIKREAFRGKLKELSFYQLQKSVWVYPYNCCDEIELLREFFGLGRKEIYIITASAIEGGDFLKKEFGLK
ncbi:MAG: hypothetical protein Q8N16_00345 [bacterium]|nr:hypothetical protein [bacterium]